MLVLARNVVKSKLLLNKVRVVHRFCVNSDLFSQKVITRQYVVVAINHKDEKSLLEKKHDPDIFGTLSPMVLDVEDDEGDRKEEEYIKNPPNKSQKLQIIEYATIIKNHLKNHQIKEAIDVLEIQMKQDRVKPERYIFNLLISGCAIAGYTKKSIQLYNKMKQSGLSPNSATYTSLFNACANTPWLGDGLKRADHLRDIMLEKGFEPNTKNYNAMIKAYGRCGDVKTAFELVDIMTAKNIPASKETFNFMLQACISDKQFGFRHALLVWHKLYEKGMKPDIYSFNLLLKCTKDCNLGDIETTEQVLQKIIGQNVGETVRMESGKDTLKIEAAEKDIKADTELSVVEKPLKQSVTPNLLSKTPHLGSLVKLDEITQPQDRLLILGGVSGFLNEMDINKVKPDLKTFTSLLQVAPPTKAMEKMIVLELKKRSLKCDVDFFNILMKKRSMRYDYEGAREVLSMIQSAGIKTDIATYGVLALGCTTFEQGQALLAEMNTKGIRPNNEILGSLLKKGCLAYDFKYITQIINVVKVQKLKPNAAFLTHLAKFDEICENIANSKYHPMLKENKQFRSDYVEFKEILKTWQESLGQKNVTLKEAIDQVVHENPWNQFKTAQSDGFEVLKNSKVRHKTKFARIIKKIKVNEKENDFENSRHNQ